MQTQSTRVLEQIISSWSHDIHHNDTQQYDTKRDDIDDEDTEHNDSEPQSQHDDSQHYKLWACDDTQHKGLFVTVSMNDIQN